MSDTPKFEVIDRRKMKAEEEKEARTQRLRSLQGSPLSGRMNQRRVRAWW